MIDENNENVLEIREIRLSRGLIRESNIKARTAYAIN